MGSSGGESGETSQTMRYAPYVEAMHEAMLSTLGARRDTAITVSPYAGYTTDVIDEDFFGVGYIISSFSTLYDMFGKFMAGLDVEDLWSKAVSAVLSPAEVQNLVKEQREKLEKKVECETLPAYQLDMRDINAVMSSSFVIGKGVIEDQRVKDISKISLEATERLLPTTEKQWTGSLNWNKITVATYAKLMRDYFADRMTVDAGQERLVVADKLWPFTVIEYDRKALQAIVPRTTTSKSQQISLFDSPAFKVVSVLMWTAQGAYIGSVWPGYGTVIGAAVGFVVGLAINFLF